MNLEQIQTHWPHDPIHPDQRTQLKATGHIRLLKGTEE